MKNRSLLIVTLCSLAIVLGSVTTVRGAVYTWTDTSGDNNWATATNWTTGGPPTSADSAVFAANWVTQTITLPSGTTTVSSVSVTALGSAFTWANPSGGSATLSVTGNFTFGDGYAGAYNANTFAPVLNVTGQLIGATNSSYQYGTQLVLSANGDTVGGGISAVSLDGFTFTGNANTINGGITVEGDNSESWKSCGAVSYPGGGSSWSDSGYGFVGGVVAFTGTGNVFGAGVFNLNRYGTIEPGPGREPEQHHGLQLQRRNAAAGWSDDVRLGDYEPQCRRRHAAGQPETRWARTPARSRWAAPTSTGRSPVERTSTTPPRRAGRTFRSHRTSRWPATGAGFART